MAEQSITRRFIVGDIHGHLEALERLLAKLGLSDDIPAGTELVFLGDLIDRGPESAQVVERVKALCESGKARCILGNHEFNFVQFNTETEGGSGIYRRKRSDKNVTEIAETWASYRHLDNPAATRVQHVEWMKTLPVALSLDGLQMIHACWEPQLLSRCLQHDGAFYLSDSEWDSAWQKGTEAYARVETLCKGLEQTLPNGGWFYDKGGVKRREARVAWWNNEPESWRDYIRAPGIDWNSLPDNFAPQPHELAPTSMTLFGHYWFDGEPRLLSEFAACLDYSVARPGGRLCAYEWRRGDTYLSQDRLHWLDQQN